MAVTRTFSIIKPDATRRNLTGAVTKMLEDAGLRVVASKPITASGSLNVEKGANRWSQVPSRSRMSPLRASISSVQVTGSAATVTPPTRQEAKTTRVMRRQDNMTLGLG